VDPTAPPADPPKPPSSPSRWRLTKMALVSILSSIRGIWSWQNICNAFTRIRRHIGEPPRRRKKQCDHLTACLT
jgi:hypothetical protein